MRGRGDERLLAEAVRSSRVPYAVLAICTLVVLVGTLLFRSSTQARDAARLQNAVQSSSDRIANRIDTYVALLLSTRAMLDARDGIVDAEHFRTFVADLDVQRQYPGIQGIGFSRRFTGDLAAFEREATSLGMPGLRPWPEDGRDEQFPIVLLEPQDVRNRAALGYDMFSEPVRREAMIRARDTGSPAASGTVTLVQEIDEDQQAGFLLYVPVYRGGGVPPTLEARREALLGFVYAPFRANDLFRGIFGSEREPRLGFEARDAGRPDVSIYRVRTEPSWRSLAASSHLELGGRTWALSFWTLPAFDRGSNRFLWPWLFAFGMSASLSLFVMMQRRERVTEQLRMRGQVLDSMSEGVTVTNEDGVILYTNPAEDEMFGYARGELVGKHVTTMNTYAPEENARIVRDVIAELRRKGFWGGEFENVRKDGTLFTTAAQITALPLGGRTFWVCVQNDVTEPKRIENERAELLVRERALRAQAEEASRTKDDFLAMLGHELRNPLSPIVTALALLQDGKGRMDAPELAVIERQVRHLRRLVDDLLDVAAITRGKVKLERRRIDVASAVRAAIEVVRPLVDERRHTLRLEVTEGIFVDADEARLVQVVSNLLNNAAKYTDPGGHIDVRAARVGEQVEIRVRDDGPGIAEGALQRLFEPFEQGERTADRRQGGLGIGLAVVRSLVQLHGGTVEGNSEGPGRGTEFVVRLPAVEGPSLAAKAPAPEVAATSPSRRVLVVDDNEDAADLLARLVERAGHHVDVAHDGEEALERVASAAYDVAILDIGLPGMDGYELAARLRARGAPVPTLVALTGYGQESDRKRSRAAGFDHHMVKPVDTPELLAILAAAPRDPRSADRAGS